MDTKQEEIGFPATIRKDGRITIPEPVRKSLGLKVGDSIYITKLRKMDKGDEHDK